MNISKLEIQNFRGLRAVTIEVGSPLQVIAGRNNIGKTTVLEAIDFFFQDEVSAIAGELSRPQFDYFVNGGSRISTKIKIHFDDLTSQECSKFQSALIKGSRFWLEIKLSKKGGEVKWRASKKADGLAIRELLLDCHTVVKVPALRAPGSLHDDDVNILVSTIEKSLVRKRPGGRSRAQKEFHEAGDKLLATLKAVLDKSALKLNETLLVENSVSFADLELSSIARGLSSNLRLRTKEGTELGVANEGTGFQSLLALGVLQAVTATTPHQNTLYLIEEPEAFLHPQLQRQMAKRLGDLAKNAQVITTTHSTFVVDAFAIDKVATLKEEEHNQDGLTRHWVKQELTATEIEILSRYCDVRNSELVFADGVIFCEGFCEILVLRALCTANQIKLAKENISLVPVGGKDALSKFIKIAKHMDVPYFAILDRDAHCENRKGLREACKAARLPLMQPELLELDRNSAHEGLKKGEASRDAVNAVLRSRSIFTLSSDIEGACVSAYNADKFFQGAKEVGAIPAEFANELEKESKLDHQRLARAIGSKNWLAERKSKKCKPYLLGELVAKLGQPRRKNSDLMILKQELQSFIKSLR